MSTHSIGFYEDLTKIIFELSSNIFCCYTSDHFIQNLLNEPLASEKFSLSYDFLNAI